MSPKERIALVNQRDKQLQQLKAKEAELVRRIAKVAALQKRWQSTLLNGCDGLTAAVLKYEGELIRIALESAGGSLTKAARPLGVSYQALAYIIDTRQKELLPLRSVKHKRQSAR